MHTRTLLSALLLIMLVTACSRKQSQPDGFQLVDGFTLDVVAREPLIRDPVDIEFDAHGNAFVLEMPGYPFGARQSRIMALIDKDNDGTYDDASVFADSLQLADSFMPYRQGMLVAAPPYLLYVKDLNNDYKADAIDTLMGGFATGNLQHNYNGLTSGLDGWIYAANGGNDGAPYWWGDTLTAMDLKGQDFRFSLDLHKLERIGESSGGFNLTMNEWGHVFETHNLTHVSHLVFPDRYLRGRILPQHTLENISDHEENGLARVYPIGEQESRVNHPEQSGYFSGACGITYYGGGAFGPEYDQTVWVADVVLNLLHVDKLSSNKSSYSASRVLEKRDFLASTDRSFRPVNMTVGPDGALYVVDMYRQVIEHPEWIPDEIEKDLDLNAGMDKGRIYRISRGKHPRFKAEVFKDNGLIASLSHPNQWVRMTAHRLLLDRELSGDEVLRLQQVLANDNALARVHALWILDIHNKLGPGDLTKALGDPAAGVRENALRIAEQNMTRSANVLNACMKLLTDDDQRVRMQAALSLSILNEDAFSKEKNQVLTALLGMASSPLDKWQIAALTLAAQDASHELFDRVARSTPEPEVLKSLALASSSNADQVKAVLRSLSKTNLPTAIQRDIINQLANGASNVAGRLFVDEVRQLETSADRTLIAALAQLRVATKLPPSPEFLSYSREALKRVTDKSLPDSVRVEQMDLLVLLPYREKAEVLFKCLHHAEPLALQERALQQLSKYREPEIGRRVVALWKQMGPDTRRRASDLLLYVRSNHDALLTGLENGTINIGEMNFDLERRRMLLWWTDNEDTKRRAEKLFSDAGVVNRKDAIEKMKPALALKGSATNGESVFQSVCSSCHVFGSKGKEVGPVLTEISRKSKESLMHDILDPNAAADTKYISHRVETKSGDIHVGIIESENDRQLVIKMMGGSKVTVNRPDIVTLQSMGTSLMMEGLENSISHQQMADLLAYLQNQE